RRQHHLPADRHQQLVAEVVAQPRERTAHRRLAQIQPVPGPGHVPLGQQRIEGDEQVEVEEVQVHGVKYRLCRYLGSGRFMSEGPDHRTELRPVKPIVGVFLAVIVAVASNGASVSAHHSFAAEFDFQKPVTLKGVVVQWEMINPHGWITLDVTGGDGKTARWMVETSNPNGLMRLGWTKRSLKAGDQITIDG